MSYPSLFKACNRRRSAGNRRDDDRKRLRCDASLGDMDSTRRYDVISKLSFGDVWTNHDDSRDSGFGDDEWLPHDCSLKSTSGDKKIGIRLDFKDFLATSSLSSATMKTSDVAIRDVINTPRHSLEGSTVRSRPVSVFTPVCRQSPIGNAQPKLAPRRLRRRLCFGLVDAYDAIGQQPTNGSTAAAERLENVIVDDLYDATTSFCDVIDNRGTDSCLSRCQQQPQPLRLCDSRSKTVSWLTCTDNGLPQYVDATDLIGDFSRPYSLPAVVGKHPDLRSISPDVMADLLLIDGLSSRGSTYVVVDCRYPFEYEAGHIQGAVNIYTKSDLINEFFMNPIDGIGSKHPTTRTIVVFHCEFSSKRGPSMARFMRKCDRLEHGERYPMLCYPELYVIDGGYKAFYEKYAHLCTPRGYLPMLHRDCQQAMRRYRAQCKRDSKALKQMDGSRSLVNQLGGATLRF